MAGYTRQSVADIIANAVIKAAPVNAEYNAIRDAFAFSGGHKHDGSSTEGAYVPLIADVDALNKAVVDTANNRISFFSEVGGAAVEQVRIQDGAIVPVTTNDVDLGTSSLKFKNLYVEGIGAIGSVTILGGAVDDAVIGGTTPAAGTFTSLIAATADLNGGTIDDAAIGGTTPSTGAFTNITASGTSDLTGTTTITSADIDSGAMDNTVIGAATPAAITGTTITGTSLIGPLTGDVTGDVTGDLTGDVTGDLTGNVTGNVTGNLDGIVGSSSPAAGSFTTVSTSGQATLATVDVNGGSIDGTIIGASTAAAITGTTITGTSLVGPVTGNVTGDLTGDVTGDLTGDVTGNVNASSGSSTFNNVVIDGTLNMNAGTTATIQNLTAPVNDLDAATKKYVDDEVAALVDSAPGTLDTLNELAAALGDDADFSNTVTTSIATKLPLAGGTMTGAIAMSTSKITGLGDPTAAQDAMTKAYADTTYLGKAGGTMTGAIDMGSAKITTTYTPTDNADLTTKTYVDAILGSGSDAAASAAAAATSETNAATSETNAATSETNAATSEANAAASYDDFDDRYLGAKSSAPTVDNDGDALIIGALYFNNTTNIMYVYGSGGWQAAGSSVNGTSDRVTYTATAGQTVFAATYDTGYIDVYLNGVKLAPADFTATNGTSVTLASGAAVNDIVDLVAYGTFVLADHYTEAQSDARYVNLSGDTMTGDLNITGTLTSDGLTVGIGDNIGVNAGNGFAVDASSNIDFTSGGVKSLRIKEGDISFYEDTGTTPKFFWDASAESLSIGSPSSDNVTIYSTDDVPRLEFEQGGTVYADIGHRGASAGARQNIFEITTKQAEPMAFRTNNSEAMRIDSSGNVGIGTSSPSAKLHMVRNAENTLRIEDTLDSTVMDLRADSVGGFVRTNGSYPLRFLTNNTERMRIDSSGNLLVGKTSGSIGVQGFAVQPSGQTKITEDGADVLRLNRLTSDGTIIDFRKDGTTVGSIGAIGGDIYVGTGDTTLRFYDAGNAITPRGTNGAGNNGVIDLGGSSERFKDLYLSGGVYLGGTGSANKLDDYEEGNWTPTSPTVTFTGTHGRYTKIGRQVIWECTFIVPTNSSGVQFTIDGYPFAQPSGAYGGALIRYSTLGSVVWFHQNTGYRCVAYNQNGTATSLASVSGKRFDLVGFYTT